MEHPEAGVQALQRVVGRHLIVSVPKEPLWCALNLARGKYIVAPAKPSHPAQTKELT
jgi:hypothetical protein